MTLHFEELWEQCEKLHIESSSNIPISNILDELSMKISLYRILDLKNEVLDEEHQKIKSRTLGEILLTLTNLSLKENINVFEALNTARQYRKAEIKQKIPKDLRLPK